MIYIDPDFAGSEGGTEYFEPMLLSAGGLFRALSNRSIKVIGWL